MQERTSSYYLDKERFEDGKKVLTIPLEDFKTFDTFETRCPYLYRIRTETNELLPFIFNEPQKYFHEIVEEEFQRSVKENGVKRCEILTLKPRQFGCTTYAAIRNIDFMLIIPSCYGLCTNHVDSDIPLIYDKYETAYDNLPDFIEVVDKKGNVLSKEAFKPETKNYSSYTLKFANQTKAWLNIRTAGAGDDLGKGSTINLFHATETANYAHYDKVLASAKQMMSNPNSFKFFINETTANGTTGKGEGYYKDWMRQSRAWKKFESGETTSFEGARPVFIKWYTMKKYRKNLIDGELITIDDIDFGSPEMEKQFLEREKLLVEKYDVPLEAINWYRYNIKQNCGYKYADACRYYPTFPEDAFLATNNCFFDTAKLYTVKETFESGKRDDEFERGTLNEELEFIPSIYGELTIKHYPEEGYGNRYIVSLDQSEGLESGDYTSMKVFDRLRQTWVAHWFGKAAEDVVAYEFMKLGYFYNTAFLIPESNRATVINMIKPDGVIPYEGELFAQDYRANGEPKWGWNTNVATRKLALDELYSFHRDTNYEHLFDLQSVEQHLSFTRNVTSRGTVRYEASEGNSDDIVFADALTIVANNRIEEEIYELNEDVTDIARFVEAPLKRKKRPKVQAMLGRNKRPLNFHNM